MTSEKHPRTLLETSHFLQDIPAQHLGTLSCFYLTSIEFRNTALEKQLISMCLGGLGQRALICKNLAMFNIGMAFELIYKVLSLCDSGKYNKTHKFETLHNNLVQETKQEVEVCVIEAGWQSANQFIQYLDRNVRQGD